LIRAASRGAVSCWVRSTSVKGLSTNKANKERNRRARTTSRRVKPFRTGILSVFRRWGLRRFFPGYYVT